MVSPSHIKLQTDILTSAVGFPDSYLLWRSLLASPALQSHILIAVDLPGYGGSDSLPDYGPESILETMTAYILGMREQFLTEGARLILMTHDWGAIVGARLAAEAPQLADRFIICSGVIVSGMESINEEFNCWTLLTWHIARTCPL